MAELLTPPYSPVAVTPQRRHWLPYLLAGVAANALLWSAASTFLKSAPSNYVSEWSITLPAAGSITNINLPNIGTTTAQDRTPYDSPVRDPRENYKFIIASRPVREAAAAKLGMTTGEFGSPRVEIVDNTTLINLSMEGETPDLAQQKAIALYEAFQEKLEQLRLEEKTRREGGIQTTLRDAQRKLEVAQSRLSEFKARSGLTSPSQVEQLSNNIESLRGQRAILMADKQQAIAQSRQLSSNLNVSPPQVTDALTLNSDQLFQQNLLDYSQATAALDALSTQLGPNHPAIVQAKTKRDGALAAMRQRGQLLLGRSVNQDTLARFSIQGDNSARENLFQQVITNQSNQSGLEARASELTSQIAQLEGRLKTLAQNLSTLESLQRDVTIAEALFSSALARLNLGQSDAFGSYPQVQTITEPELPGGTSDTSRRLVLLGTSLASILTTLGITTLWLRSRRPLTLQDNGVLQSVEVAATEAASLNSNSSSEIVPKKI